MRAGIQHRTTLHACHSAFAAILCTRLQTPDPFTCPYVPSPSNSSEYVVHYNPMATLSDPLGEDTISRLFARGVPKEFGYTTLWALLLWCARALEPLLHCSQQSVCT